jgi:hypothetical protein
LFLRKINGGGFGTVWALGPDGLGSDKKNDE